MGRPVRIYITGSEDGLWCTTMEYIEGQNLIQALQKRGQVFPEAEALCIISQIGDAVSLIHRKDVPY